MKKVIAALLAVLLVVGMLPAALAAEIEWAPVSEQTETADGADEPVLIAEPAAEDGIMPMALPVSGTAHFETSSDNSGTWVLDANGTLTISGSGPLVTNAGVSSKEEPLDPTLAHDWLLYADQIKSVVISAGVTAIADYAFTGCSNLTSVTIPEGVARIGRAAFKGCSSLKTVKLPDTLVSIGVSAFQNCSALGEIQIPVSVSSMGGGAFSGCSSLKSVNVPSGVTGDLGYAFENCTSLTSAVISGEVTELVNTFAGCTSLTDVKIPQTVTSMPGAFSGCSSLKEIQIPAGVTQYYEAFENCTALTNVVIPEGITFVDRRAFEGCTSLQQVTLPSSITVIRNYAFSHCTSLSSVSFPDNLQKIEDGAFRGTAIKSLSFPAALTAINSHAFSECLSLEQVTIPATVKHIGAWAFGDCDNLKKVSIAEGVETGLEAFASCDSLESITFPRSMRPLKEDEEGYYIVTLFVADGSFEMLNTVIYGYSDSAAKEWVDQMNEKLFWPLEFVALDAQGTPEPTPDTPEPTPDTPKPTPDVPEPTPSTPEPTPDTPETTPDTPEPTPDTPETPPVEAEAVYPLPNGLEILVTEVPETEKAKMESAVDTMLPAADDMKVVYVDISLVETASQDEKHDQSVTVHISYPAEIAGAWRNYTYTVVHGAVQSDGSITPEIVSVTPTADGLVYQGSLSPFAVVYQPKKTVPGIGGSGSVSGSPSWPGTGTGAASNPLSIPTGADNVGAAIALLGVAAAALSAGAARVRKRK